MTTIQYPRPMDVRHVLRWNNEGPEVFRFARGSGEKYVLTALRDTIIRLGMGEKYEAMRAEVLGNGPFGPRGTRHGQAPRDELLASLLANLRVYGYIHPRGPVPDGRVRPYFDLTPLTARQLHVIRLYAWGYTTADITELLGIDANSVRDRIEHAREQTGTATRMQLLACCYRNNWFPGHSELRTILGSGLLAPGYREVVPA